MKKRKYRWLSKEFCESVARKYKTLRAFCRGDWSVASKAMTEGWLDEYTWIKRQRVKRGTYSKEFCESVARKYKTLRAFCRGDWSVASKAMTEGWLDEYTWIKRQRVKRGTYSKEECRRLAKTCKTLVEFRTKYLCAEVMARRNGWLKEFTWLERRHASPVRWTTEALIKESKKYKTLTDFYKGNRNAYCVAYRHGLLDQFTWLERKGK